MASSAVKSYLDRYLEVLRDQDPVTPGLQSKNPDTLSQALENYQTLRSEDQYQVLVTLRSMNQYETIRGLLPPQDLASRGSGINGVNRFVSNIEAELHRHSNTSSQEALWFARKNILKQILGIEILLEEEKLESVQDNEPRLYEGLCVQTRRNMDALYQKVATAGAFSLFDTDFDGIFDDKDLAPIVPSESDQDGDLVADKFDPEPANPELWNPLPEHQLIKGPKFDMYRDGDTTFLITKIHLHPPMSHETPTQRTLNLLRKNAEDYFLANREPGSDVRLRVEFVKSPDLAHHSVTWHANLLGRVNESEWDPSLLKKPATLTHETLHLLGLEDRYEEVLVDSGVRMHSTAPGFHYYNNQDLMRTCVSGGLIQLHDLRNLVTAGWNNRYKDILQSAGENALFLGRFYSSVFAHETETSSIMRMAFNNGYHRMVGDREVRDLASEKQPETLFENLRQHPDDILFQLEHISYLSVTGQRDEAVSRLDALLQKKPHEGDLWLWASNFYKTSGDEAKAMALLDQAVRQNPQEPALYFQKAFLLCESKKFDKLNHWLTGVEKKFPRHEGVCYFRVQIALCQGDNKTLVSLLTQDTSHESWITSYFLRWMDHVNNDPRIRVDEIVLALRKKGRVLSHEDLRHYARWEAKQGGKQTITASSSHLSNALERADDPNIDDATLDSLLSHHVALSLSDPDRWIEAACTYLKRGKTRKAFEKLSGALTVGLIYRDHSLGNKYPVRSILESFGRRAILLGKLEDVKKTLAELIQSHELHMTHFLENVLPRLEKASVEVAANL